MSIINHEFKHIFIHVPRTAGSSLESLHFIGGTGHCCLTEMIYWGYDWLGNPYQADFLKWAFVRNPYDRLVSGYHYVKMKKYKSRIQEYSDFRTFVLNLESDPWLLGDYMIRPQYKFITVDGKISIDFVGHFENLHRDFNTICRMIGVGSDLPHLNSAGNWLTSLEHYDADMKKIVNRVFETDFKLLQYNTAD